MAIKINSLEVIDNSRGLANIQGTSACTYRDWHPAATTITNSINFATPMMKLAMSGNVTFSESNKSTGATAVLLLDTSTSAHTPTFSSNVKFPTTPAWSSYRHWIISFICWDNTIVRATAVGFAEPGTPSATMDSYFDLAGWNTRVYDQNSNFGPFVSTRILFTHDTANNRIRVDARSDTSSSGTSFDVLTYVNYTGLNNITSVEARYNMSQSCGGGNNGCDPADYSFGPLPSSDGYASGTYYTIPTSGSLQFPWATQRNTNDGQGTQFTIAFNQSSDPDFQIKVVDSVEGTFFSSGTIPGFYQNSIELGSTYGVAGFSLPRNLGL